jgi:hypothetical protein
MSAFKSLTSQDVIVVPFVVNKSFSFVGSASLLEPNVFIERLQGTNITSTFISSTEPTTGTTGSNGYSSSYYQRDVYNSIKQLYYSNELPNPEGIRIVYDYQGNIVENNTNTNVHSRFDNYLNTTLSGSRLFQTQSNVQIAVISIPSQLYGDYINPGSFYFKWAKTTPAGAYYTLQDDGEGYLIVSGNLAGNPQGIISYQHGLIAIMDMGFMGGLINFTTQPDITCSFQSSRLIYETQYKCTIRENEFNYTLNPSVISGSNFTNPLLRSSSLNRSGQVYGFVTGSNWAPYVTTVGLYNENQELLAVAKLSQPLPTSRTTDTSILINIDR